MLSEHFNLDFLKHKFKSWDACEWEMQVSKLNKGKNSTCGGGAGGRDCYICFQYIQISGIYVTYWNVYFM